MPTGARRVYCYTLTRGTGELILDEQGSLHFMADPKPQWREHWPRALRRLSQAERSLMIARDQIRVAVPFYYSNFGPSVVVGYRTPDNGMGWEEFILAGLPTSWGAVIPYGDAQAWAETLVPKEVSQELQDEAARYRRQIHRRLARATLKFVLVVGTAAIVFVAGTVMLAEWPQGTHRILFELITFGCVWLFFVLITFLMRLWTDR